MAPPISDLDRIPDLARVNLRGISRHKISVTSIAYGILIALAACGVALFYLAHTGKIVIGSSALSSKARSIEKPIGLLVFDPILVNLADKNANTYLQISVVIEITSSTPKSISRDNSEKVDNALMTMMRDAALNVLGSDTSEELLAQDGKQLLKRQLKIAFTNCDPAVHVEKIFFTNFLVQQ